MIQPFISSMITLLMAKFIINDLPHAVGLLANPNADDHSWDNVWMSCQEAARILGKPLTEQDEPANWPEMRRLHKDLWAQVYGMKAKSSNPAGKFDDIELGTHCAKCGLPITRGAVPYKKIGDEYYHEWCLEDRPKFIMYHASPAPNTENILQHGILPAVVPHQESPWAPAMPVVYISDSIEVVKDYAEQAWEYYRMEGAKWAIFKIEYDEFPEELYSDLLWGVPGVYYVTVAIPPDHIKLVEYFDAAVGEQKNG